ncbi:MAG: hypothetical protein JWO78_1083 [Micavibrio sp.]|nr:hypothetical protein [Micavibrio sp.]
MMSPLEYLFVMMMRTNNPDADSLNRVEPALGSALMPTEPVKIDKTGRLEMRTILMEAHDPTIDKLEAPLRITPQWEPMFKIGNPLEIKIDDSGKSYNATISRIEKIRDENGESIQVIATMGKPDAVLQPGLTATATMKPTTIVNN